MLLICIVLSDGFLEQSCVCIAVAFALHTVTASLRLKGGQMLKLTVQVMAHLSCRVAAA